MAISDNQKLDYLFKKLGYGATKTDTVAKKLAANESIASPLLIRGDTIWAASGSIPSVKPASSSGVVTVQTAIESTEDITATGNRTWKTGITDWIPTEFGSTYLVNVYVHTSGDAAGAESMANKVFTTGSGNNDEWFFDYQSGVLNFIGDNLPDGVNFTGKSVYITGATYSGSRGVASAAISADIAALQTDVANILSNTDPAALDSLTEIVTAFQAADGTFATSTQLAAQNTAIRSDLALTVEELNDPVSNVSVANVTGLKFDVDGGFALTDNADGTVTITLESTFKTWHIYDTVSDLTPTDIVASAVDEISIRAGNNITITPVTTPGSKGITIASDISGLLDLGISEGTNGQILQTDGVGGFSFVDRTLTLVDLPASQEFTANGVSYAFTLTDAPADEESVDVYVNDVLQRPSIYSLSGTTLTFNVLPDSGFNIYVKYRYPYATMSSPANSSIQNQHLNLVYTSNQYTGDNSTTDYSIQPGNTIHSVLVIVNGLILAPTAYSISGATLTITTPPTTGSVVDFRYLPN
jgi:hypothetical protein|tara:strand:+ start:2044 stop:3627 length:1584 start_codon:yes stop_codon:yes gene_type:complete